MTEFKTRGNVVDIVSGGVTVFSLAPGSEPVSVGYGEADFAMDHGSFKIKDQIYSDKPLRVKELEIDGNTLHVKFDDGALDVVIDGKRLYVKFFGLHHYNRLSFALATDSSEHFYGTGETFSEFDLKGHKVNVWVAEHMNARCIAKKLAKIAIGRRDSTKKGKFTNYETYYAQPTFLSSRKYYFHSFTTARAFFDFSGNSYIRLKFNSVSDFVIGMGDTFEEVVSDLTDLLGRQPELPDWVYDGAILGIQGGTDIMMKKVDNCLDHGMDVNGVWIQDWQGRRVTAAGKQLFWNWEWDKELYPGLDEAIKKLNEKNIKVLGYCNPFLAIEKPLYKEASEKGYCVKNKDGEDYYVTITTFPAAMVDFTNPEAYEWLKGIIKKNMIEFGLSGWMADFGEYLPTDCVLYSGEDAQIVHNTWPQRWAKLNREALEETGKLGEIMFFTRSGYTETPKYSTMMWNGDNHVDFSFDYGMPSVIPAMLSLTCCGFGLSHSDIGGYTTFSILKRSEELYMRWCEMNAFSPVMRSHEGLNPDLNAQFDASETVIEHQSKMSKIHVALKPYIKAAVKYNAEKGVGVVRPLFFYYDEKFAYTECYEYLLGRDVLVAPVIRPGESRREVYLPDDEWIHFFSGKEYKGGHVTVDAPLGCPPVFYRKNADPEVISVLENARSVG
ncbi:MAG: alpha-glucosidase [Clostridia bacterium]|nr:alpha-glucosidase [Clostridia bacterium]